MKRRDVVLRHEFVEHIPEVLKRQTVYISIPFATVVHKCCCGCGNEVVTPLSPTDWKLIFNGQTISLEPSIGNWGFRCQSHYWIRQNRVRWADRMSAIDIQKMRENDVEAKAKYFKQSPRDLSPAKTDQGDRWKHHSTSLMAILARLRNWFT